MNEPVFASKISMTLIDDVSDRALWFGIYTWTNSQEADDDSAIVERPAATSALRRAGVAYCTLTLFVDTDFAKLVML